MPSRRPPPASVDLACPTCGQKTCETLSRLKKYGSVNCLGCNAPIPFDPALTNIGEPDKPEKR